MKPALGGQPQPREDVVAQPDAEPRPVGQPHSLPVARQRLGEDILEVVVGTDDVRRELDGESGQSCRDVSLYGCAEAELAIGPDQALQTERVRDPPKLDRSAGPSRLADIDTHDVCRFGADDPPQVRKIEDGLVGDERAAERPQRCHALEVTGRERLLDERDVVRLERLDRSPCLSPAPTTVGVDAEERLRPDQLSRPRNPRDIARDSQPHLDLERPKTGSDRGCVHLVEALTVAGQRELDRDLGPRRTAERDRERHAQTPRVGVPQGGCDARLRERVAREHGIHRLLESRDWYQRTVDERRREHGLDEVAGGVAVLTAPQRRPAHLSEALDAFARHDADDTEVGAVVGALGTPDDEIRVRRQAHQRGVNVRDYFPHVPLLGRNAGSRGTRRKSITSTPSRLGNRQPRRPVRRGRGSHSLSRKV